MQPTRWTTTGAIVLAAASSAWSQPTLVTRAAAVAAAVARGPRLAVARTDSAAANAAVGLARRFENPVIGIQRTESTPHEHYTLEVPLDLPWLRSVRVGSARSALGAASWRLAFEREAVAFDADTAYTRALVQAARSRLSARSARNADSLLVLARLRRDAGDASDLDVELVTVTAGQLANAAAVDSLEATTTLLSLQALMGMASAEPAIALTDTLDLPDAPRASAPAAGVPLLIAAAQADARAAELAVSLERRRVIGAPSLSIGYETGDPGGTGSRRLPSIGIALPLPLFHRNGAAIRGAEAQRDRAAALLVLARIEQAAALARAQRALAVARERAARSGRLVAGADRVAVLSLLAYREGAAALPAVLEAQRTAREALAQYLDDVASARTLHGFVRLLSLNAGRFEP